MTTLELMTVMHSLKALHEDGKSDSALKVINRIIAEAEKYPMDDDDEDE